jgi:HPt (histidine-containing phosphotransfer) domain-containing protein
MKEELKALDINVDDAINRFIGREDRYFQALGKFAADIIKNGLIDISKARTMEHEDLRKYIHGLKGVTANLSLTVINGLFIETEQSIKAGNPDFEKYQYLSALLHETSQKIIALLSEIIKPEKTDEKGSGAECRELLASLNNALQAGNANESEQVVKKIRAKNWDNINVVLLNRICELVDGYDYAGAMEIIEYVG